MIAGFFVSIKPHFMHQIATEKMQIRCVLKWEILRIELLIINYQDVKSLNILITAGYKLTFVSLLSL